MLANAKPRFFWPGMGAQVRLRGEQCRHCDEFSPSQAQESLAEPPQPTFPFELTVTDFGSIAGRIFLVYADRYTGWAEVDLMSDGKAAGTIILGRKK